MAHVVLRDMPEGLGEEEGKELGRVVVPDSVADEVVALLDKAIKWGYEASYAQIEEQ